MTLCSKSWMEDRSGVKPEHFAGPRRGDRRRIVHLLVGDHLGASRRVVGRDDLDAGERPQEPIALRQRLRMRIDAPHLLAASCRAAPADDERPAARPRRRSAGRARAAGRSCGGCCRQSSSRSAARRSPRAALDGVEDILERAAGQRLGVGVDLQRRRLAEGSRFSLIRDTCTLQFRILRAVSNLTRGDPP